MALLRNGSVGTDVKEVQTALEKAGYSVGKTGANGVYGNKTTSAVLNKTNSSKTAAKTSTKKTSTTKTSTKKETSKKDTSAGTAAAPPSAPATGSTSAATTVAPPVIDPYTYDPFTYDKFTWSPYQQSETVSNAFAVIDQMKANAPGAYQSEWKDEIDDYMNRIENRDPFSYDFNTDALYNQYKDQYIQQGQMAMMDTMGQAAAMTGGYGNSYAQAVGQQAYNQQLSQLNNVIPELYQMAYNRYNQEGQDLLNMYNMYLDRDNQDYGRYQNDVDRYYRDLDVATDYANNLYNREYGEWADQTQMEFDTWANETKLDFDQWATGVQTGYNQWATLAGITNDEYLTLLDQAFKSTQNDLQREHDSTENALDREWKSNEAQKDRDREDKKWLAENGLEGGGLGGGPNGSYTTGTPGSSDDTGNSTDKATGNPTGNPTGKYDTHGYTTEQIKQLQAAAGIKVDGIWGEETQKAYDQGFRYNSAGGTYNPELSKEAQDFINKLPYANAGTTGDQWKAYVLNRLTSSTLSEEDKEAIAYKLGL